MRTRARWRQWLIFPQSLGLFSISTIKFVSTGYSLLPDLIPPHCWLTPRRGFVSAQRVLVLSYLTRYSGTAEQRAVRYVSGSSSPNQRWANVIYSITNPLYFTTTSCRIRGEAFRKWTEALYKSNRGVDFEPQCCFMSYPTVHVVVGKPDICPRPFLRITLYNCVTRLYETTVLIAGLYLQI